MKIVVNLITASRIVGAGILLFAMGYSSPDALPTWFFAVYIWCVISDLIDGPISRKTNTTSDFGALFDSIADVAFIAAALIIFVPRFPADATFGEWIFVVIGVVVGIRVLSMIIGLIKYKTVTLLHTYSSKAAALIMCVFPILWIWLPLNWAFSIIATAQSIASLEELIINIYAKELNRNVKGIFEAVKKGRG